MNASDRVCVLHLMRTYGKHGGEQQLSQLFGANQCAEVEEIFAFVFKDPECATLFAQRAPQLAQLVLWSQPQSTGSAWRELLRLIPRLPMLQWRYFRRVAETRPDVCVVHGFQAALVAWPTACWKRSMGHAYVHRITKGASRIAWAFRVLYLPFRVVAGNSSAVMQSLAPYANPRKLMTLDNGIDLEKFDRRRGALSTGEVLADNDDVVISVGRLLPYKGQDLLIDAVASLLPVYPRLMLWIVGDGASRGGLERQVRSLGIQANVVFLGQRSDVPALLGRARLFANASSWEGMSNAILEGMASGLPSVVADAPGVSECHVRGVTGLVVDRNPQALARGMAQLLADPEGALRMARAARERVEAHYSIAASRARYDHLYSSLKT
jgi:glycosyltransferase involved in cell wall biosynthesis